MAATRGTTGGGRSGTRTPKGEETRSALLRAASTLFAEQGYHQTSVPDIVRAAGVGHGTFYEYFGSRRAILVELTRQVADVESRLPRLKSQDLAERVRAEIFWYLSDHVEHLELSKVWHEASNADPEIAETRRRERARRIARVRKGIEAAGTRPDIDPEIAAAAAHRHARGVRPAVVRRGGRAGAQRPRRGHRLRDPGGAMADGRRARRQAVTRVADRRRP